MPEGLVKISQGLYENILPLVKTQVASQIKVRDFSRASVSIQPAEHASWSEARAEMMTEAKRSIKAQMQAEIAGAADEEAQAKIRAAFDVRQAQIETNLDHEPMELHLSLGLAYNVRSMSNPHPARVRRLCTHSRPSARRRSSCQSETPVFERSAVCMHRCQSVQIDAPTSPRVARFTQNLF